MKAKRLFLGLLTATVVLTPLTALKSASATEQTGWVSQSLKQCQPAQRPAQNRPMRESQPSGVAQQRAEQMRQGQAREMRRQRQQRQREAMRRQRQQRQREAMRQQRQQRQREAHWRQAAVKIKQGAQQLQKNRAGLSPRRGRGAIGSSRSGVDWSHVASRIQEGAQLEKYRGEFVQQLLKQATSLAKGYNVMVFNLGQKYEFADVQNQKLYEEVNYNGHRYGIWIFKKGKFTNKGDSGWINWGMSGNFTRDGKTVTFH